MSNDPIRVMSVSKNGKRAQVVEGNHTSRTWHVHKVGSVWFRGFLNYKESSRGNPVYTPTKVPNSWDKILKKATAKNLVD